MFAEGIASRFTTTIQSQQQDMFTFILTNCILIEITRSGIASAGPAP